MKKLLFVVFAILMPFGQLMATDYYAKLTGNDGSVSWVKLTEDEHGFRASSWTVDGKDVRGALDLDEVWTEAGGTGTKHTIYTISGSAFFGRSGLTSVKCSSAVKVCFGAFADCTSLTSVSLPKVEKLEEYCFGNCTSLTSFYIPSTTTSIHGRAFEGSKSLTNLTVDASNTYFSFADNILYNKNKTTIYIYMPCRNDAEYVVPSTVNTIYDYAFSSNKNLTSVILSNGVKTIYSYAFANSPVKSVFIPQSVTSIGVYPFEYCKNLESVKVGNPTPITLDRSIYYSGSTNAFVLYVPQGSKTLYEQAKYWKEVAEIAEYDASPTITFADENVKTVCVSHWDYDGDGELSEEEARSIRDLGTAFQGNTSISTFHELRYFTNLESVAAGAFSGCTNLTAFTLPGGITYIGENAFLNTAWLNSQPDGLLYIGSVLYSYRGTMPDNTTIVVRDGTTSICNYAFNGCGGLTAVTLPESLTRIGEYAFGSCSGLTTIKVPSRVKNIERYAFFGSGLVSVELPEGLESIGNSSFRSCTALESVVIPDSVRAIGKNTFRACSKLQSVTMPRYLMSVKTDAFRDCKQLKRVDISNLSGWCNIDFEDARANPLYFAQHLYLNGKEVVELETSDYYETLYLNWQGKWSFRHSDWETIKPYVFYGCESLKMVTINDKIASIGINAFGGCSSLTAVKMVAAPFILSASAFPARSNTTLYVPKSYLARYQSADVWSSFKEVRGYPDADVNVDGDIDVVDVVDIARYVAGSPSDAFVPILADLNSDKTIDIDDAKQAINNVAWSTALSELSPASGEQPNRIRLDNFEVRARKTCVASIMLENASDNLVGFQMDITLPEGLTMNQNACRLSNRIADGEQTLNIRSLGNNTYRLTSVSLSLQPITGNDGELIVLPFDATNLTASGTITTSNVRFVTSNSERKVLENAAMEVQPVEDMRFCEGDGTEENPYLLLDANDFVNLATDVNGGMRYGGVYFKVGKPVIDFVGVTYTAIGKTDYSSGTEVIYAFLGHLDGNHTVIKNLSAKNGLFGYLGKSGTVSDITLDESCTIADEHSDIAGIAGVSKGTITNCVNKASVTGKYHVGGICGDNMGTISNCKNYGTIKGTDDPGMTGGIAGDNDGGKILDCENHGFVTNVSCWIGGIVGLDCGNNGTISGCTNDGDVTARYCVGGIIGYASEALVSVSNNYVTNCTITGTATSYPMGAGAIVSIQSGGFANNYYTEDVVVKVGKYTYDGITPRGVWGSYSDETIQDITKNDGAKLKRSGDVNGDKLVNALDIQKVINAAVAESTEPVYDLNGDGIVNALDIQTVINAAAAAEARQSGQPLVTSAQ